MKPLSRYVKVRMNGQTVFLEQPKLRNDGTFISGEQVRKNCEGVTARTPKGLADVFHLIQLGPGVKVTPQNCNRTYCELENFPPEEAAAYWSYPETPDGR